MASVDHRRRHRSRSPNRDRTQERDGEGRNKERRRERENHRDEGRRERRNEPDRGDQRRRDREHSNRQRRDDESRRKYDDRRRERGEGPSHGDHEQRRPDKDSHRKYRGERSPGANEWGNEFGQGHGNGDDGVPQENTNSKAKGPNFELSGKLTEYTNTYKGVVIKYNEPPEAKKPRTRWRLYPFKGQEAKSVMYVHRQSAYLIGRQRHITDIPVDHPSCSKQHAALQYRLVNYEKPDGTTGRRVRPYIIDLDSSNGTYLNNQRIEARRYYELKEQDVLKFGFSTREYVLLHEHSEGVTDDASPLAGTPEGSPAE